MIGASSELEAFSLSCFFGSGVEYFFFEEAGDGQPSLELRLKDLSFVGASFLRFLDFLGDSLGGFVLDFDEEDFLSSFSGFCGGGFDVSLVFLLWKILLTTLDFGFTSFATFDFLSFSPSELSEEAWGFFTVFDISKSESESDGKVSMLLYFDFSAVFSLPFRDFSSFFFFSFSRRSFLAFALIPSPSISKLSSISFSLSSFSFLSLRSLSFFSFLSFSILSCSSFLSLSILSFSICFNLSCSALSCSFRSLSSSFLCFSSSFLSLSSSFLCFSSSFLCFSSSFLCFSSSFFLLFP